MVSRLTGDKPLQELKTTPSINASLSQQAHLCQDTNYNVRNNTQYRSIENGHHSKIKICKKKQDFLHNRETHFSETSPLRHRTHPGFPAPLSRYPVIYILHRLVATCIPGWNLLGNSLRSLAHNQTGEDRSLKIESLLH